MLNSSAVLSHRLRLTVLAAVLATCLTLASFVFISGASAEPAGGSGSGSAGQGCALGDGTQMDDGEIDTYRTGNRHGSTTCSNGTVCRSDATKHADGTTTWTYACRDSGGTMSVVREPTGSVLALALAARLR